MIWLNFMTDGSKRLSFVSIIVVVIFTKLRLDQNLHFELLDNPSTADEDGADGYGEGKGDNEEHPHARQHQFVIVVHALQFYSSLSNFLCIDLLTSR